MTNSNTNTTTKFITTLTILIALTGMAAAADDGSISISNSILADGDSLSISVSDNDLNTSSSSKETIIVNLASGAESISTDATETLTDSDGSDGTYTYTTSGPVADRNDDNQITKDDFSFQSGGDTINSVTRQSNGKVQLSLTDSDGDTTDDSLVYNKGESVKLKETGDNTGTFDISSSSDSISVSTSDSVGTLQVADEGSVSATYVDSDSGSNRAGNDKATVEVDTDSPTFGTAAVHTGDSASSTQLGTKS